VNLADVKIGFVILEIEKNDGTSNFHLQVEILVSLRWQLPGALGRHCARTAFYPCW